MRSYRDRYQVFRLSSHLYRNEFSHVFSGWYDTMLCWILPLDNNQQLLLMISDDEYAGRFACGKLVVLPVGG